MGRPLINDGLTKYQRYRLRNLDSCRARDREAKRIARLDLSICEAQRIAHRSYYHRNRDLIIARRKTPQARKAHAKEQSSWRKANRSKSNAIDRAKRARWLRTRPDYRVLTNLRNLFRHALNRGQTPKNTHPINILGCSIPELRIYIESRFSPGMSWTNYNHKTWHIHHIMPCASFDLSDPAQLKRCFHFSNLMPLWAHQNIKLGHRITTNQFQLL